MRAALVLFLGLASLAACGSTETARGPFSLSWQDDHGQSFERVRQELSKRSAPPGADIAVGVTEAGLVGKVLPEGARWTYVGVPKTVPIIAGSLVIIAGEGTVTALDAGSGRPVWSLGLDFSSLVGAGDDGELTALSILRDTRSELVAVDRDGDIVLRSAADTNIGVPAVLGGIAFVPWGNQFVSAIDLETGDEAGRLLAREQVSRALRMGGRLYFGETGLLRFDSAIGGASVNKANSLRLPTRELPGAPTWQPGAMRSLQKSARANIQIYAHPSEVNGKPAFARERYASTYFRVVLGLDSKDGRLSWVRTLSADILGGAATEDGFVFCSERGTLELFSGIDGAAVELGAGASGGPREITLGEPVSACVVQVETLRFRSRARNESLPDQMAEALTTAHPQMATVQAYLLEELARRDDAVVTKTLIDVTSNPRTSPGLGRRAATLLAKRRNGAEYMLSALEREYDFLRDVLRGPPVGPLAEALSAMKERRAAPLLARHLNDPANSPADIEQIAEALTQLAGEAELSDLKMFFALYRATADEEALLNAVAYVAHALWAIGGSDGRRLVEMAALDPLTHPVVRKKLAELMRSSRG